jgi:hypothetical protein
MNGQQLEAEKKALREAGCGWVDGVFHKGTEQQQKREKELDCIDMINSIIAYGGFGFDANRILQNEKQSYHDYLLPYCQELGEAKVLELIEGQLQSIVNVKHAVFEDGEGCTYNELVFKENE